jgi:lipopolysaccharide assembly outer membrane protein LptD (OstA)
MDRREIVTMKLDALYNRLLSTQKFRSITGELDLNFTDNLYIEVKSMYDFLTHDFEELNLDLKFSINDTLKFQAGRRFTDRVPVDPNLPIGQGESRTLGGDVTLQGIENDGISFWTASFNWEPTPEISMSLTGYFNAKEDDGDDITFQLGYERECWGVMVKLERYDDTVIDERTQTLDIDTVNEIQFFFTIKSLHLKLFSQEPD